MRKHKNIIFALIALVVICSNQAVGQEYFQGKITHKSKVNKGKIGQINTETHYRADGSYALSMSFMRFVYIADSLTTYQITSLYGKETVECIKKSRETIDSNTRKEISPILENINGRDCLKITTVTTDETLNTNSTSILWIDTTFNIINKQSPTGKGLEVKCISDIKSSFMNMYMEQELESIESGYFDSTLFQIPSKEEAKWIEPENEEDLDELMKKANDGDKEAIEALENSSIDYIEDAKAFKMEHMIETSDSTFANDTKDGIVIVDFWAIWCIPCQALTPKMENIAKEHKNEIKVLKLDIDKCKNLAKKYNAKAIPLLLVLKNGKEIGRISGLEVIGSEAEIWKKIENVINK